MLNGWLDFIQICVINVKRLLLTWAYLSTFCASIFVDSARALRRKDWCILMIVLV